MKKNRLILIILSVLILIGCVGMTFFLLFSNYRNIQLIKQAQNNFQQGGDEALALAEAQLLKITANDSDNEAAFVMLAEIARRKKIYPEQVYYSYMAYRLNPLSEENQEKYIESLCFARYFNRLEIFLAQKHSLSDKNTQLLLYAAGCNGNINKYKTQLKSRRSDNRTGELALMLFEHKHLSNQEKLFALKNFKSNDDAFLQQEILAAQTELYLNLQDINSAEKCLRAAYELNAYAFAPVLGRFYADYRNIGKALEIFEKHLSVYHDQSVAIQAAELYCLVNKTDKIAKLRTDYQSDTGTRAMLCNYYLDALTALARKDMTAVKELTVPLRANINSPLAAFMFFCADIQGGDLTAIQSGYEALLARRNYLNLQEQADNILSDFLKKSVAEKNADQNKLLLLATRLYSRKQEAFTAKFILLTQKRNNSVNILLLQDALKRFGNDQGVIKLAIEYYLKHDQSEADRLIGHYKNTFAEKSADMLRYEIFLNMQKKDYDKVSELFQKNFTPDVLPEYWTFASTTMRQDDLIFLGRSELYKPFCQALILLKKQKKQQACDMLEKADARGSHALLFFAAKVLAENGRNQTALKKYALIPQESPYRIAVLLNMAELYAENGNLDQALLLAARAYDLAPQMPETQLCYADKQHKKGNLSEIPDIIKLTTLHPLRRRLEPLWIAGMQQRIKDCSINTQREKLRELCRQLLVIAPDNSVALDHLKKLRRMQQ